MSDDCCRPTHTFEAGAYNATQVRLYGLEAPAVLGNVVDPDLKLFLDQIGESKSTAFAKLQGIVVKLGAGGSIFIFSGFKSEKAENQTVSSGIIHGYAYEGHCYDIPKPKIMFLPVPAQKIPADDCKFDRKGGEGYRVWVVDKLSQCVEAEVNRGTIDELVLEANLPGKRSPSTYRATAMVAHRSGRLMD